MDESHEARAEFNRALAELPEQERERIEKFKQKTFAHFEKLTGLSFDRDMENARLQVRSRWNARLKRSGQRYASSLSAGKDPQKGKAIMA